MSDFVCPICGNTDTHSIGSLNGKPYCRRCISFKGEEVEHKTSYPKKAPINLSYELSPEQKELSDKLVENYKAGIDSLVFAVCGSGKTEVSLALIQKVIEQGWKVAFAVPRKDVVIELHNRLKNIFRQNKVIALYGGQTKEKTGDLVVLTTHQLYRYHNYFSLIIMDEIDAFPFKNNDVLKHAFLNSLCGHYVVMSATPSKEVVQYFQKPGKDILRLEIRFHHHPLPVPQIIIKHKYLLFICLIRLLRKYVKNNKPVFIFCPTIEMAESLFSYLRLFLKKGNVVHSKKERRKQIIEAFRNGFYQFLVTTSVLERGVTVKDLQVIVYHADHEIYDQGTLVQIAGRAGRKKEAPEGEVIFIASEKTKAIQGAIDNIKQSNKALEGDKNELL